MTISEIIAALTLEQKARLCSGADFWHTEEFKELGIPAITLSDGPCGLRKQEGETDHMGVNKSVTAVCFPTGSCVANSFDRDLIQRSGEILGEECQAEDIGVLLGPAINIKRSPLCGRNFEYYSEDPFLTGELAAAYINGVQSKGVGTSVKHYAAHNQEHRRMTHNSIVDERTLREIYLTGFEIATKKANPWTVMCSYNRINGEYASENKYLLTDILRDEWGFDGFTVSDWGAINQRVKGLFAGLDLEMPGGGKYNDQKIVDAIKNNKLDESVLNQAVERILSVVFKYTKNRKADTVFQYDRDHNFARKMAGESMVLLKNENLLPLDPTKKISFIGEFAKEPRFQGGGSSHVSSYKVLNALDEAKDCNVTYAQGYNTQSNTTDSALTTEAVKIAKEADIAVLFMGIPDNQESEGFDRKDLKFPQNQEALLEEITQVQQNIVVVVQSGGPLEMPWVNKVGAILYAYLGGEAGSGAIADILFGKTNPSGKLAETFPKKLEDTPSYLFANGEGGQVVYREGVFVGYRYYDRKKTEVLFPFGHGLSYTNFSYSNLNLSSDTINDTDTLKATVTVKNTGKLAGKEVVQLYVSPPESDEILRPEKELKGFEKVELQPNEEKNVSFHLDKRSFAYYNETMNDWFVESGNYKILIGKSSRQIELEREIAVLSTQTLPVTYTLNSTIGQICETEKGEKALEYALRNFHFGNNSEALGSKETTDSMLKYMTLQAVLNISAGAVTLEDIQQLLAQINS